jgi:hypothetical protein
MPDPGPAAYLLEMSNSLGLAREGFHGASPVSYLEMQAWMQMSGLELTVWEAQTLREMSQAYCDALHGGRDKASFPPWDEQEVVNPVDDVKKKVKGALSVLKKKR